MIIAVTAAGDGLDAPLDPRFGRAAKFILYNTESGSFQTVGNAQNLNAAQGAGIQTAQNVAAAGAQAVISGHFGPKAFRVLSASGIAACTTTAATVREALELHAQGKLAAAREANAEGHWI